MRKFHKQKLKELISTLKKSNSELFKIENKQHVPDLKSGIYEFIDVIKSYITNNVADTDVNKQSVLNSVNKYSEIITDDINNLNFKQFKQLCEIDVFSPAYGQKLMFSAIQTVNSRREKMQKSFVLKEV